MSDIIDMETAIDQGPFDLLVFTYNGNASGEDSTSRMFIIRNTDASKSIGEMSDMEESGFQINGAIQLANIQIHFTDTNVIAPTKFLVTDGAGEWSWLHKVEVWDPNKYLPEKSGRWEDDGRDFTPPYEP